MIVFFTSFMIMFLKSSYLVFLAGAYKQIGDCLFLLYCVNIHASFIIIFRKLNRPDGVFKCKCMTSGKFSTLKLFEKNEGIGKRSVQACRKGSMCNSGTCPTMSYDVFYRAYKFIFSDLFLDLEVQLNFSVFALFLNSHSLCTTWTNR